jgi:hypothetical protein
MGERGMGTAAAMSELTTLKERATRGWRRQQRQYAPGEDFPLGGYATAMSVYGGVVATIGAAVRLTGTRLKTVGELISCPFCVGMWVSTGFTAGFIFAPRATRLAATTLAALAGSDFLQFAYAYAEQHAS